MADIFISYKREDRKKIEPLALALKAQRWDVWWDRNLLPGDMWDKRIPEELAKSRCVIVAWSKLALQSSFLEDEARTDNRANKLVPIFLEIVDPPLGLGGVQAEDFSTWNGKAEAEQFQNLCSAILTKLAIPGTVSSLGGKLGSAKLESPEKSLSNGLRIAVAVVALVGIALAGNGIWKRWFSDRKGDFQVSIAYAGITRDAASKLDGWLGGKGWTVKTPIEGRPEILGKNEVRYGKSERMAKLLAEHTTEYGPNSERLALRPVQELPPNHLEVWVSRTVQPNPIQPPAPPQSPIAVALDTWDVTAPDQAYCFQRKDSLVAPGKFLIRCFQTLDGCNKIQRTDSGTRTNCAASRGLLSSPLWKAVAGKGGIENSWFKYSSEEFPRPFPQFGAR